MLEIRPIMNSAVEKIFAFKTCCSLQITDQNLEIQIVNRGAEPVVLHSFMDLTGGFGTKRIPNLLPHGDQSIAPGQITAFYCTMDEALWEASSTLCFQDTTGKSHCHRLKGGDG